MPEFTIDVEAAFINVFSIGNNRNTYTRASMLAKLSARLTKTTTALPPHQNNDTVNVKQQPNQHQKVFLVL